jgi:trimeric autotransporter adhesin
VHPYINAGNLILAGKLKNVDQNIYKLKKHIGFLFIALCSSVNAQIINTIAGTGVAGYSGDSGIATAAQLFYPYAISTEKSGIIYFSDWFNHCVRKIDQNGIISTVAGTGSSSYSGDGGPAALAQLHLPTGVCSDAAGNIYISDYGNRRIRKIDTSGNIATIAGTGSNGFSGDGGPAIAAQLNSAINIAVDIAGNIFIADMNNDRIRKIDANGIISTIAGSGTPGYSGDGGQAVAAQLRSPQGVAIDKAGNLFIADANNHRIRRVNTSGVITTIAGTGVNGYTGDGGPAAFAQLYLPSDVDVDTSGNLYIVDEINCCIRKIDAGNIITTIAGTGKWGVSADGGQATGSTLYYPKGMGYRNGRIYISDTQSNRIRMFSENTSVVNVEAFETGNHGLTLYPNPANSELCIEIPGTKEFDLEIYNASGGLVLSKKKHASRCPINISTLNNGLYYYKVKTQRYDYAGRLVKEE